MDRRSLGCDGRERIGRKTVNGQRRMAIGNLKTSVVLRNRYIHLKYSPLNVYSTILPPENLAYIPEGRE
jgi:hypothetical protein